MPTDTPVIDLGPPVIDLGVVDLGPARPDTEPADGWPADEWEPADPAPPPADAGTGARLRRWWPLVALSVVLVASTAGAAPVSHGLAPAYQVPAAERTSVALTADTMYVATGTPAGVTVEDPVWRLDAYHLADGLPQWTVLHDVTSRPSSIGVTVLEGLPLVTGWRSHTAQMGGPPVTIGAETAAYDPHTGAQLWVQPGFAVAARPGRVVLDLIEYAGSPPAPVSYTITEVALATGHTMWTHRLAVADSAAGPAVADVWTLAADGRHLATLRRDGRLVVRELGTGGESVAELGQAWHDASLTIAGDRLQVSALRDRRRTLAVYDLDPLRHRWRLTDQSSVSSLTACGPVLCLQTRDDGMYGLDPAGGEVRWRAAPGWQAPAPLPAPWPAGQLQVNRATADAGESRATRTDVLVVAAATGRPGLELGAWRPFGAGGAGGERHPYPVVQMRHAGLHQPGHPDYDPGRLWLGRVGPDLERVEVLGSLDRVTACDLGERYLACVSTEQRVEVWRIG